MYTYRVAIVGSPFDITKSLTQTHDDLSVDEGFNKDYTPFMINRILSNSGQTALFADAMNQCSNLDKKLQYDFYRFGIPKSKTYTKYIKKDSSDINQEHLDHICSSMNLSQKRAIEIYDIIGSDNVRVELDKHGGKK
jgi:hypothetical protein